MYTAILDEDNIEEYAAYLGEDEAENIGRAFFRGLVLLDDLDEPLGGMIWELKNLEEGQNVESHIHWFDAGNEEEADALFMRYSEMIADDGVEKSEVCIQATRENSKMKKILKQQGFDVHLMEGDDVAVGLSEILNMPIFKKSHSPSGCIYSLENMELRSYRRIIAKLDTLGQKGTCEDLSYLPLSYFEKNISCYYEDENGIQGLLLFHRSPSGSLYLKVMRAVAETQKEATMILMQMLFYAVEYMRENCSDSTQIIVDRHNDAAFLLAEKLYPRGFGKPVYCGSRMEK
ncbi:hypothetical protein SAMN02910398_03168 [Butyrivibrio sp. YAB3001]|nr:hypothetical protein SAMN02910398_03168 [Butyrivibrio sp. YAB3001]